MVISKMSAPLRFFRGSYLCQATRLATERCFGTSQGPALFRATPCLLGNPMMKKKKRVDHQMVQLREAKTKRRLERAIKKLEARGRKLKPVDEIVGDRQFMKTLDTRQREPKVLTFEESEEQALLLKAWGRFTQERQAKQVNILRLAMDAQDAALTALREESEELYQQAIQIDPDLLPFEHHGPSRTPPVAGYTSPDGDYTNTTKKYDRTTGHIDVNKVRV